MECPIRHCYRRKDCRFIDQPQNCSLFKEYGEIQIDMDNLRLQRQADQSSTMDMYERGLNNW